MFTMSLGLSMGCGMLPQATLEKLYAYSVRAEAEGLAASLFYCFHLLKFCRC